MPDLGPQQFDIPVDDLLFTTMNPNDPVIGISVGATVPVTVPWNLERTELTKDVTFGDTRWTGAGPGPHDVFAAQLGGLLAKIGTVSWAVDTVCFQTVQSNETTTGCWSPLAPSCPGRSRPERRSSNHGSHEESPTVSGQLGQHASARDRHPGSLPERPRPPRQCRGSPKKTGWKKEKITGKARRICASAAGERKTPTAGELRVLPGQQALGSSLEARRPAPGSPLPSRFNQRLRMVQTLLRSLGPSCPWRIKEVERSLGPAGRENEIEETGEAFVEERLSHAGHGPRSIDAREDDPGVPQHAEMM
jgi:hypothetical protein